MGITILKYPDNIEEDSFSTRRVVFMAIPGELLDVDKNWYKGEKGSDIQSRNADEMPEVSCMITLPLPGSLSDNQSHTWSEMSLTGVAMKVGKSLIEPLTDAISKGLGDKMPSLDSFKENAMDVYSAGMHLMGIRKRIPNPGAFQTYGGSGLRSFTFSFDFIPETKNEAKNIIDIVSAFKTYSSPSEEFDGILLASPFLWQISITNGTINKLLSLSECACTNVTVTYGTDKFDTFEDGMPKKISLSLSFNETSLKYANNYNKGLETQTNDSMSVLSASNGFTNSMLTNNNVLDIEGSTRNDNAKTAVSKAFDVIGEMKDNTIKAFEQEFL